MGITYIQGQVKGPRGRQAEVRFLVDNGATYSFFQEMSGKPSASSPSAA
jgi:hypothetical protein